jgi:serine protease Do
MHKLGVKTLLKGGLHMPKNDGLKPEEPGSSQPKQDWVKRLRALLPYGVGLVAGILLISLAFQFYIPLVEAPGRKPLPIVEAGGERGTPEAVASTVSPAVVGIISRSIIQEWWGDRRSLVEEASGTGVIFDRKGYICTNNHVVSGAKELMVSLADGRKLRGKLVGADPVTDLAVVKVEAGEDLPVATLGDSDDLRVGQTAVAIGNPIGMEFQRSVTVGVISGLNRILQVGEQLFKLIQTDAVINPGNSGGPLVNTSAEVVGINTIKIAMPKVEGMGFAIPINTAKPIITMLKTKGKISRPWIGVSLVSKAEASQYGINFPRGLLVIKVIPGSPAADAKIQEGDIITQLDGQAVNDFPDLSRILRGKTVGDLMKITLQRDNSTEQVNVRLGETPGQNK